MNLIGFLPNYQVDRWRCHLSQSLEPIQRIRVRQQARVIPKVDRKCPVALLWHRSCLSLGIHWNLADVLAWFKLIRAWRRD